MKIWFHNCINTVYIQDVRNKMQLYFGKILYKDKSFVLELYISIIILKFTLVNFIFQSSQMCFSYKHFFFSIPNRLRFKITYIDFSFLNLFFQYIHIRYTRLIFYLTIVCSSFFSLSLSFSRNAASRSS